MMPFSCGGGDISGEISTNHIPVLKSRAPVRMVMFLLFLTVRSDLVKVAVQPKSHS